MFSSKRELVGRVGCIDDLDDFQRSTLESVKRIMGDELAAPWFDDVYVLKWCRSREFDVEESVRAIREHIKWDTEKRQNNFYHTNFMTVRPLLKNFPFAYHGVSRAGLPVQINRLSELNVDELLKNHTLEFWMEFFARHHERTLQVRLPACRLAFNKPLVDRYVCVMDIYGLGITSFTGVIQSLLKTVHQLGHDHYPELMEKMVIVNAPYSFSLCFKILKAFLPRRTINKFVIIGDINSSKSARAQLDEIIAADQLPGFLGGTAVHPGDPRDKQAWIDNRLGPWHDATIINQLRETRPWIIDSGVLEGL